jgi:hypothetical protein
MPDDDNPETPAPASPAQDVSDRPAAPDFGPVFTHAEEPSKEGINLVERETRSSDE